MFSFPLRRFCVGLVCGPQPERDDFAFRLTAHFDTNWVVRNSKLNKEWGEEEGAATAKFPFRSQQPFKIEIFTSPSTYLVSHYQTLLSCANAGASPVVAFKFVPSCLASDYLTWFE